MINVVSCYELLNCRVALKGLFFSPISWSTFIRSVYGFTVQLYCMWAKDGNGGNRAKICCPACPNGCSLHCHWIKRHIVKSGNCSGELFFFFLLLFYFADNFKGKQYNFAFGRQHYPKELFLLFLPKSIMSILLF